MKHDKKRALLHHFMIAAPLWLASASHAAEPQATVSPAMPLQALLGLLVIVALMGGTAWLLKRAGVAPGSKGNVAKVVGGVAVGNRERVLVVEVGDQWIVVGVAPGQISALSTMPRQEMAVSSQEQPDPKNFAAWLKHNIEKRNGKSQSHGQ